MCRKLFFALLLLSLQSICFAQNYVTLHEDCNYGGKNYYLEAGTYRGYQMKIDNDKLSSIQIPAGMKVTIYENDNFSGRSQTYTSNVPCLEPNWNDMASSIVVENSYLQNSNPNDYVVFYNDCYSKGFSKSLKIGTYTGSELGSLKNNISSFTIYGNLRVRVYVNNENASGYFTTFDASQTCLSNSYNDKISSLVVEYNPNGANNNYPNNNNNYPNNNNNSGNLTTFYTDCNYGGNSIRLMPGYYSGEKLGLFRYDISSIEIPNNVRVKVYQSDNMTGNYTTITSSSSCLTGGLNNQIGSVVIDESRWGNNNNNNYPPANNNVMIYVDANYRGQSATLLPGTYSTMSQISFPDKAISSIVVPAGYRVVLYEYENFGGKSFTITESRTNFTLTNWNDRASSIAVYRDR